MDAIRGNRSHYSLARTHLGLVKTPKVIFLSEADANAKIEELRRRTTDNWAVYQCDECGHFHVGRRYASTQNS